MSDKDNDVVVVRTQSAGVFIGRVVTREGGEITLADARRVWYWDGAATLSELAFNGTSAPQNCKWPVAVPSITLLGVIEIIPTTAAARATYEQVPVWMRH